MATRTTTSPHKDDARGRRPTIAFVNWLRVHLEAAVDGGLAHFAGDLAQHSERPLEVLAHSPVPRPLLRPHQAGQQRHHLMEEGGRKGGGR
eukprot:5632611-Pyramimonas_sp.AAC.1